MAADVKQEDAMADAGLKDLRRPAAISPSRADCEVCGEAVRKGEWRRCTRCRLAFGVAQHGRANGCPCKACK